MEKIFNKGELFLTIHSGDGVTEYYRTNCLGKVLVVTTNQSNNVSKTLVSTSNLSRKVVREFFPQLTSKIAKN